MDNDKNTTNYRKLVIGVDMKIPLYDGSYITSINFDNAATTPPFQSVLNEIINFSPLYSSIHRGCGYKSIISSKLYDDSRSIVANFVHANLENDTIIYVKNTTEAINKLANRLCIKHKKCVVLSTDMEHHSNDLPWRNKYKVDYISIDNLGKLSIVDLEKKLIKYHGNVKLVTVSGASNVTGYRNPIYEIAELSHKYGARILVDGAQLVPHVPMDMKPPNSKEHIDFLAFSSHKMYAPFGIGVLVGPKRDFIIGEPDYQGGGTVKVVTHDFVSWDDPPSKEEAGTPNIMGVVALVAAIKTLTSIGMTNIENYEHKLTEYALERLSKLPGVKLYGSSLDCQDRISIIPFNIDEIDHTITARVLSNEKGISVRNGCFCAQPYIQKLLKLDKAKINALIKNPNVPRPGMVRVSFGLYNTFSEIDFFVDSIRYISEHKEFYIKKYS